ncbi:hypothetical protein [Streptomyces virginiae]|uniref:hypothetical protein n=1 Tax=Streptomyces virginiae TaxID=1961 RepID=UPI002E2B1914|nr:hypothetical protein [Streptomyces virginiae]
MIARTARLLADRYWETLPGRLRLARAACVLLATGLLILLAVAATGATTAWDETAQHDAPRTVSATRLNLALNDMDAQTANILLSSGDSGTGKGRLEESYAKASGFYGEAQETISRSLRTLAAASEGDPATEATVVRLTDDFAHYQELIGRALENDSRPGGKDAAREDYRTATDLLTGRLLPEARKLVDANNAVYERQYVAARGDLDVQRTAEAVPRAGVACDQRHPLHQFLAGLVAGREHGPQEPSAARRSRPDEPGGGDGEQAGGEAQPA